MPRFLLLSVSSIFVSLAALGQAAAAQQANVLWYDQPARSWMTEALPIGNGSLGGMLFGLTSTERVQFNANTLWTGNEKDTGMYQAFGDVFIELNHANPTGYRRELDIDRAMQRVSYSSGGVNYLRTAFASHPAKASRFVSASGLSSYRRAAASPTASALILSVLNDVPFRLL
jgi:alpha-L-fucosidase 2